MFDLRDFTISTSIFPVWVLSTISIALSIDLTPELIGATLDSGWTSMTITLAGLAVYIGLSAGSCHNIVHIIKNHLEHD